MASVAPKPPDHPTTSIEIAEPYLIGILALGMLNGIFSPFLSLVVILHPFWYPTAILPGSPHFIGLFASLILSTLTIMLAGIPAAIYERLRTGKKTTQASLMIWVVTLAVLSMPAVVRAIGSL